MSFEPTTVKRLVVTLILGGALLLTYPAVSGGLPWDIGIACGYIGIALVLCLYIFPVRADGLPRSRLLGVSQHRAVGWAILGVALAHALILLAVEPKTVRYLFLSAPLFMWLGTAGMLSLGAAIYTGLSTNLLARALSATTRATIHIVLSAVMMLGMGAHIIGSSQVLRGVFKPALVLLLLCLPLTWFALRRRGSRGRLVTGRLSSHVFAVAVIALLPTPISRQVLLEPLTRPDIIPVSLPHELHGSVNCITCHHNYVDHTGTLACIECHRNDGRALKHSSEATFHTFCRDCHMQLALNGRQHGPTRSCSGCHPEPKSSVMVR